MERRKFIKQSALLGAGTVILPGFLAASCKKDPVLPESSFTGKVIIIGAGAAGLYAGYTLNRGGYDFQILEAASRIGGRMGKDANFCDHSIDLGAQWLHGNKGMAADLVDIHNAKVTRDKSDMYYWFNGSLTEDLPSDPTRIFGDSGAPDVSFLQYAHDSGFGAEYDMIVQAASGSYGADANDISAKWSAVEEEEWSSGGKDYKFEKTYWDLLNDNIAAPISDKISLNTVVTSIDYSGSEIVITDSNSNTYTADKVIITVPLTILQDGDITFTPALDASKTDAFNKMAMGPGMKVFLKFSERFYKDNTVGGTTCAAYADDKVGKTGSDNILLAFVMGQQAQDLTDLGSDQAIVDALVAELDSIYDGKASASIQDSMVINYTSMPYIRGAYSYATIGTGAEARTTAATQVDNKLYFAGEAMNLNGHHQTVHGALETGYEQVLAILENA